MIRPAEHYIYAYIDPRNQIARYIGQGQKERCQWWKYVKEDGYGVRSWLYRLRKLGLPPTVVTVLAGLTQAQVDRWEIDLIDLIGRFDLGKGPLLNRADGGQGINNPSAETRRKLSEAKRGNINSKGKSPSAETRRKMSEAQKGRTFSAEHKKKLSEAKKSNASRKDEKQSEETRRKLSEAMRGNTYRKGKKQSEETRRKISDARKGRVHSAETRRKMSEAQKGKKKSEATRRKISEALKGNVNSLA